MNNQKISLVAFFCQSCKKIGFFESDTIKSDSSSDSTLQEEYLIRFDKNSVINVKDLESLSNHSHLIHFPLCKTCLEEAIKHHSRVCQLMTQFSSNSEYLSRFSEEYRKRLIETSQGTFFNPNQEHLPQNPALDQNPQALSNMMRIPIPEPILESRIIKNESTHSSFNNRNPNPKPKPNKPQPQNSPIRSHTLQYLVYHVELSGPFGLINGQRVGTLLSSPVPISEIQSGLIFLGNYLFYLLGIASLDRSNIRTGQSIIFIDRGMEYKLEFTNNKKEIPQFNKALDLMILNFQRVFSSPMMNQMMLPKPIDITSHSIDQECYLFNLKSPDTFTYAMRNLIFDLKTLQYYNIIY